MPLEKQSLPLTFLFIVALLFAALPKEFTRAADPPGILNHQGRIAVNDANHDGPGFFKFSLVKDVGGTEAILWHHDGTALGTAMPAGEVNVTVTKGHYAALLGDTTAGMTAIPTSVFADNDNVSLRIWFRTDGVSFEQLAPDRRVASVGYALSAGDAATVAGITTSGGNSGTRSSALGLNTTASGSQATAMGDNTTASGNNSLAFGFGTQATNNESTAFGVNTTASGLHATAFGIDTTASGNDSLSFGNDTNANGHLSTAFGFSSVAGGFISMASGQSTTAPSYAETAIGTWNTSYVPGSATGFDPDDRVFVVGNGTADGSRSDALVVRKNGNVEVGGAITLGTPAGATEIAGMVRWTGTDFEGYDGSAWVSLMPPAAGSITATQLASDLTLGGTTNGTFSGDGSGLTNIPAGAVATPPPGMVLIPAGEFTMGNSVAADTDITDAAPVSTTVSAFYMDVDEVTLSQWQVVQQWGTLVGDYTDLQAGSGKEATHPVQTVNWYDCVKWCNARSEREGKTPVYYTDNAQTTVYRTGNVDVTNVQVNWTANGYRLPTEAEWEKAARGGLSGKRFPWGDIISQKQANYYGNTSFSYDDGPNGYNAIGNIPATSPRTSPVGSFAANGYGLNDMAGNVFEWCWDLYGTPYTGGADPQGPATGSIRVIRGGGWLITAVGSRCASRFILFPGSPDFSIGFRVVLALGQP